MCRTLPSVMIGLSLALILSAAPVPRVPPDATKDREGNPLPKGATARLGSLVLRGPGLEQLTFSKDGRKLFGTWGDGRIYSWSAETGRSLPTKTFKPLEGERVGFAGKVAGHRMIWLATKFGGARDECTVVVYDLAGKEISRFPLPDARPYFGGVPLSMSKASVSRDGKLLAVITEESKTVAVYELESGKLRFSGKVADSYNARVYFSPNASALYVDDQSLRRFEVKSGKELPPVDGRKGETNLARASSDGKWLVTRGWKPLKDESGRVRGSVNEDFLLVHDMKANKCTGRLEIAARPLDFRFAGNDVVIVLSGKFQSAQPPVYSISRWNLATLKREWQVPAPPLPDIYHWLAVSPDGKRFVVSDRRATAQLYDAETGKVLLESSGHSAPIVWMSFAPEGESVATVARNGARIWTLKGERKSATNTPEFTRGRLDPPQSREHLVWVSYSEKGNKAELLGWDSEKQGIGWRMTVEDPIPDLLLSHDGKRCVGVCWNEAKRFWNVTVYDGPAGKKLHTWTLNVVENRGIYWWPPLALSPDGKMLFVGSKGISGLDVATGKEKVWLDAGELEQDYAPAPSPMTVSPDGTRLALVSKSKMLSRWSLRIFDIKSGKTIAHHLLGEIYHPSLRFDQKGKTVAICNMRSPTVQICSAESSQTEPRKLEGGNLRATCAAFSPNGTSLAVGYQDGTALLWDLLAK